MNISDSELRERLMARGYNPPPVTDSSRGVLIKKLKKLEVAAPLTADSLSSRADTNHEVKIALRTRLNGKNYESSPEVVSASPHQTKTRRNEEGTDPDGLRKVDGSPRRTRTSRKDTEPVDSVITKVKTTSYDHIHSQGDPFEKGSDLKNSFSSAKPSPRLPLGPRMPLGTRSEYYSTPAFKHYDVSNGISSDLNRSRSPSSSPSYKFRNGTHRNFTSTTMLSSLFLFFIVVAGIYYSKNDQTYDKLSVDGANLPKCSARGRSGISCIPDEDVEDALDHAKTLYRLLWKKEAAAVCDGTSIGKLVVSEKELIENMATELGLLRYEAEKAVINLKILVNANPQFKLSWSDKENGFKIENAELPWSCTVNKLFSTFLSYSFYVAATVALLFSMHILSKFAVNRYQEHNVGTQKLVQGIVKILQQNAISNPSRNYLPIVHVRDQLISFADRERKKKMWADAIRYVEANESRVRKEIQPFQGEDYDVWRWLGGNQLLKSKMREEKAFETSKDITNKQFISPTPCLKIRHMFDPENETNEDWSSGVKDAILELCEGVNIVHLVVDESNPEGCVYMKCATTADAGMAHKKINGAWHDGKIVTVKYLRVEKYHERFPASSGLTEPLLPSGDQ